MGFACQYQGQINIVLDGEGIQQVELLKHEAQVITAECGDLALLNFGKLLPVQNHTTLGGLVQRRQNVQ